MTKVIDIPAELLDDILHLVIFDAPLRWYDLWRQRLNLSSVGTTFKNVIYGSPRYWSRLFVHPYTRPEYIQFCLRLSGSGALYLWVNSNQPSSTSVFSRAVSHAPFPRFLAILRQHLRPAFHRVVRLQIKGAVPNDYLATITELEQYGGSTLTRLYLQFDVGHRALAADYAAFGSLPRLSYLVLHCTIAVAPPSSYASVTTLVLRELWLKSAPRWTDLRSVLVSMPRLEELQYDHVECVQLLDAPRLLMESLVSLVVRCDSEASLLLVGKLDMPQIAEWHLTLYNGATLEALVDACNDAFQRVRKLELDIERLGVDDVRVLLCASGSIRHVDISLCSSEVCHRIAHFVVVYQPSWCTLELTGPIDESRAGAMLRALAHGLSANDVEITIYGRGSVVSRSVWRMVDGLPEESEVDGGRVDAAHRFSIDDHVKY
ncbi:hypothetical protein B0H15DRAFT_954035 [Mycena belliarum]|uniref:F-box domain-containing protein n=1 Tax=Mycena belliarum TaxID=1033014 RepID=A0AAD6TTS1_9AGAR|nr:hypothetical protein B0H15DRAFT_954035 [Mycena belliae]